jgi:hypothetical protein
VLFFELFPLFFMVLAGITAVVLAVKNHSPDE